MHDDPVLRRRASCQPGRHLRISLQVHDDNDGDWGYRDEGEVEQDGETLWFDSGISGASYQGTVDGSEIKIMYDWCYNGVPDVQLRFAQ